MTAILQCSLKGKQYRCELTRVGYDERITAEDYNNRRQTQIPLSAKNGRMGSTPLWRCVAESSDPSDASPSQCWLLLKAWNAFSKESGFRTSQLCEAHRERNSRELNFLDRNNSSKVKRVVQRNASRVPLLNVIGLGWSPAFRRERSSLIVSVKFAFQYAV